jgi:hypothetical protein
MIAVIIVIHLIMPPLPNILVILQPRRHDHILDGSSLTLQFQIICIVTIMTSIPFRQVWIITIISVDIIIAIYTIQLRNHFSYHNLVTLSHKSPLSSIGCVLITTTIKLRWYLHHCSDIFTIVINLTTIKLCHHRQLQLYSMSNEFTLAPSITFWTGDVMLMVYRKSPSQGKVQERRHRMMVSS